MRRIGRKGAGSAIVLMLTILAGCGSDGPTDVAETGEAPAPSETTAPPAEEDGPGDTTEVTLAPSEGLPAFYGVPDPVPDVEPGTLLRSEEVDAPGLNGTLHRILYASRSLADEPIAVSGLVALPEGSAPEGGFPVVAWAHGTTGIADECAPSLDIAGAVPLANTLLDQGYAIAATDYEGLGTPGRHPYIVGESEARGVLDAVRAAHEVEGADLSTRYVVWGHSQGGHAAMFALHIAQDWAPELDLAGVVAGAPPSQFQLLYTVLQTSPFRYYLLMAAAGFNAAYGDGGAPLASVLTPAGVDAVEVVDAGCDVGAATADLDITTLIGGDPAADPVWSVLLQENDPGQFTEPADVPLLVIHGGNDEQIPVAASALMFDQLCAAGQDQTRWVYPGQSHAGVIGPSAGDMLAWIAHRFAGEATPDPMVPAGQPDVEVQVCEAAAG